TAGQAKVRTTVLLNCSGAQRRTDGPAGEASQSLQPACGGAVGDDSCRFPARDDSRRSSGLGFRGSIMTWADLPSNEMRGATGAPTTSALSRMGHPATTVPG